MRGTTLPGVQAPPPFYFIFKLHGTFYYIHEIKFIQKNFLFFSLQPRLMYFLNLKIWPRSVRKTTFLPTTCVYAAGLTFPALKVNSNYHFGAHEILRSLASIFNR